MEISPENVVKVTLMAIVGILILKIILGYWYVKGLSETIHSV